MAIEFKDLKVGDILVCDDEFYEYNRKEIKIIALIDYKDKNMFVLEEIVGFIRLESEQDLAHYSLKPKTKTVTLYRHWYKDNQGMVNVFDSILTWDEELMCKRIWAETPKLIKTTIIETIEVEE